MDLTTNFQAQLQNRSLLVSDANFDGCLNAIHHPLKPGASLPSEGTCKRTLWFELENYNDNDNQGYDRTRRKAFGAVLHGLTS